MLAAPGCAHYEVMHTPPRARRYLFVASDELTDRQPEFGLSAASATATSRPITISFFSPTIFPSEAHPSATIHAPLASRTVEHHAIKILNGPGDRD